MYLPDEEDAPDEASYLSCIEFIKPYDGEWSVEVTATVEGGATPLDNDPDLSVQVGMIIGGCDGFTAEQRYRRDLRSGFGSADPRRWRSTPPTCPRRCSGDRASSPLRRWCLNR